MAAPMNPKMMAMMAAKKKGARPAPAAAPAGMPATPMKKGGKVKCMAKGGGVESKGKTRGKIC